MIKKIIQKKRGFVILFAVTLVSIFLSIALGVSNITLKEIKFGTSAKDTNEAFFAADTGAECAMFYDKTGVFNQLIKCNNSTLTANQNPLLFWSFIVPGLGSGGKGCAKVTVDKTISTKTVIVSKGYNLGSPDCNSTSSNLVERELNVNY